MKAITIKGLLNDSFLKQKVFQHFLGKKVIITVIEVEEENDRSTSDWSLLGSVNLDGKLDQVNIRDFAHE